MKNFILKILDEIKELLKHPKKLIPTFILTAVWIILPLVTGFIAGANIPLVRLICTITYANGGIFGGFFGMLGGIFGKAVFAAVVNGFVLSICAKKNPFSGIKKGISNVFKGGMNAINPLLVGGGLGLILYWFFNITSTPQNMAIGVVALIAALQAIGKQNGLLFGLAFYIAKKLSKEKSPSRLNVSRVLTGISAGFAVALPITFLRFPILILGLGIALFFAGIATKIFSKRNVKKATAAILLTIFLSDALSPMLNTSAYADTNLPDGFSNANSISVLNFGSFYSEEPGDEGYSNPKDYDGFYLIPKNIITYSVDFIFPEEFAGRHLIGIGEDPISFDTDDIVITRKGDNPEYKISGSKSFSASDKQKGGTYNLEYTYEFTMKNIRLDKQSIIANYEGTEHISYSSDDPEYPAGERTIKISGKSKRDECRWHTSDNGHEVELRTPGADSDDKKGLSMVFTIAGVVPKGNAVAVVDNTDDVEEQEDYYDYEYVPYRGRLKYTSGITNKHGQPFPDVMDFDNDGEITYNDLAIRQKLVHNPDYLDAPEGAMLVGAVVFTTIFGTVGGAVASGGSSILGNLKFEFEDDEEELGRNIEKDAEGDLYVKDPSTGKKTLYKSNGDGTYKNMTTGDSYTVGEIKEHVDYVERNAGYFKDTKTVSDKALDEQREEAKEVSEFAKIVDKNVKKEEAERLVKEAHEEYKEKIADKYGKQTVKEVKKEIVKERIEEYEKQGKALAEGDINEGLEKSAQSVEKTADVMIDVLAELDATQTADLVKDAYVATKTVGVNTVQVVTGEKSVSGAIASAATDASVEIAKNHSKSLTSKLLTNSSGDAVKTVVDGKAKGLSDEEIKKNAKGAAASGAVNAVVDVGFDKAGDKLVKGMKNGDKVLGKAFNKEVTKEGLTKAGKTALNDVTKNKINSDDNK